MTPPPLGELLARLTELENLGQTQETYALCAELFARLAAERQARSSDGSGDRVGPSTLEYLLMAKMGRDLERNLLRAEAEAVYVGAVQHALDHRQPYWISFFGLRRANLALDLKDGRLAKERLLNELFPTAAPDVDQVGRWEREAIDLAARRGQDPPAGALPPLADLRAQRLAALGRCLAFEGRLSAAARAYEAALQLQAGRADPFLSTRDLRLALAEVQVDRGDDAAYRACRAAAEAAGGPLDVSWTLLDAAAHQSHGRLSEALASARAARVQAQASGDRGAAADAVAREAELLLTLNRLSEAATLLDAVPSARLSALYEARRAWEDDLPPSVEAILNEEGAPEGLAALPPGAAGTAPPADARHYERVAQEWGIRSQLVILQLQRGQALAAREGVEWLVRWSSKMDSPVIAAERELLRALVLVQDEGVRNLTMAQAAEAERLFAALDMPHRARDACHLIGLASGAAVDPALNARKAQLLDQMRERLTDADWRLYRLNKWDVVDWQILALLEEERDPLLPRERALQLWSRIDRLRDPDGAGDLRVSDRPQWLRRGTAIVQYVSLPDRLIVFVGSKGGCSMHVVQTSRAELWRATGELVRLLQIAGVEYQAPRLAAAAEALGTRLGLPFVIGRLGQREQIIVVPDDILVHIPFATITVQGAPIVASHAVSLMPRPRWTLRADADVRRRPRRALAVVVTRSDAAGASELPSAAAEAENLRWARPRQLRTLKDHEADRLAVLGALGWADVAHFACHGQFDDSDPERAGLAMRDAWLTVADLRSRATPKLTLATIASCWTGNARILPGAELISLAAALLEAGAAAVITALWEVPQDVGAALSDLLYRSLAFEGPVGALARAQRGLRDGAGGARSGSARAPGDWAGFLCYRRAVRPTWWGRIVLRWRAAFAGRLRTRGRPRGPDRPAPDRAAS